MNDDALGANDWLSAGTMDQIVDPLGVVPIPSAQLKAAPPQACTSIPRWRLYQAWRVSGSFALKKMPPIPVTRGCTERSVFGGLREDGFGRRGASQANGSAVPVAWRNSVIVITSYGGGAMIGLTASSKPPRVKS